MYLLKALLHYQRSGSMHNHLFHSSRRLCYAYAGLHSGKMHLSSAVCSYILQNSEVPSFVPPVALRNVIFPHDRVFYTCFYTDFLRKNYETTSIICKQKTIKIIVFSSFQTIILIVLLVLITHLQNLPLTTSLIYFDILTKTSHPTSDTKSFS